MAACPAKGCKGEMVPMKPGTPEQVFCGDWSTCTRCTSSILIPSPALLEQLAALEGQGTLFGSEASC